MGWKWSGWIVASAAIVAIIFYFADRRRAPRTSPLADQHTTAPDFSLPDLSGQALSLSSFRGKVVLLDFWATWCDPCRDEIPRFVAMQNKYGSHGLQLLGVSMDDTPDSVREFYHRFGMNYPVVMGNAKIGELYGGVLTLPVAFVIDRDGRIYSRHIGATDTSLFENEVLSLLQKSAQGSESKPPQGN